MASSAGVRGPIHEYTVELARRLDGPLLWRRRVLAETRDGLASLAEDLADDGRGTAEHEAVRQWGAAAEVAREFNAVGADLRVAGLAGRVVALVPLLAVLWTASWALAPDDPWDGAPAAMDLLQDLLAVAVGVAVVSAGLVVLSRRRTARRGHVLPRAEAVVGGVALVAAIGMCFVFLYTRAADSLHAVNWVFGGLASAASLAGAGWIAHDVLLLTLPPRGEHEPG
jgi:hypothetical protein